MLHTERERERERERDQFITENSYFEEDGQSRVLKYENKVFFLGGEGVKPTTLVFPFYKLL